MLNQAMSEKKSPASRNLLGEVFEQHREECKMTQEFVAESIGVSRQAVSKWETGASDPSTSNLLLHLQNCSTLRQKNYYVKYNKRVKRM